MIAEPKMYAESPRPYWAGLLPTTEGAMKSVTMAWDAKRVG